MKPQRIQRKRTKGWRMPKNTVYVGRPSNWGNPYLSKMSFEVALLEVKNFGESIPPKPWANWIMTHINELRGKNLACWCSLDQPCHADVLLEIANPPAGRKAIKG